MKPRITLLRGSEPFRERLWICTDRSSRGFGATPRSRLL